ncbi:phytanoyl-CoA dioxygenase family protein [Moorena sp. SIO3I6]|uniref:phytanoyl-CoA dioxygenase family protein n=1 Tax=Moorena sp. SIO3I6 TaxID=2607831 RepID=UPI0013F9B307|nr:phytanoyl-CoA dioxygenase family protein [Moorena sp. SIO3I6]NEP27359.1 hypothetical protein [Moorena sp. SIO3I6]
MIYKPHFLYRLKLIFVFMLVKLKFIQPLLPKNFREELPTGWNNHMFWVAFKSGGQKLFFDYYCKMREPASYESKTVVDAKYQLTEEDIRAFHESGYLGPFDLGYSEEEMQRIKEHLVDLAINQESKIFSYARGDYELETQKPENGNVGERESLSKVEQFFVNRINVFERHLEDSILLNLFKNPAITERCAQILGPDLLIWHSHFFWTPPLSSGSQWHQTSTWLSMDMKESLLQPPNVEDIFQVTCWIALTDAPKEKSCLKMVCGSREEIYPVKHISQSSKDSTIYGKYDSELDYPIDPKKVKLLEAKAGQCIIFCERTVHGSTDNVTDDTRWAVVGRIVRPDTRVYTQKMLEDGYDIKIYGAKKVKLDKWQVLLLRGEDRFGYNRVLK